MGGIVLIKVNEYFDGQLKSLESNRNGEKFSAGIILPGEYEVPTSEEEHLTITHGECKISVNGEEPKLYKTGEKLVVAAGSKIKFMPDSTVSYTCIYK